MKGHFTVGKGCDRTGAGTKEPEAGALDQALAAKAKCTISHLSIISFIEVCGAASQLVSSHCLVLNAPSIITRGHSFIIAVSKCMDMYFCSCQFHNFTLL